MPRSSPRGGEVLVSRGEKLLAERRLGRLREAGVGLRRERRLGLDPRSVRERDRVDRIEHLVHPEPAADREYERGPLAGADDHVRDVRRAVDEVPLPQKALLSLGDQQALAAEDEEVLLVGFPVVHAHRPARPEDAEVDPDLREALALGLEAAVGPEVVLEPARLARVSHEPVRHAPILESQVVLTALGLVVPALVVAALLVRWRRQAPVRVLAASAPPAAQRSGDADPLAALDALLAE